MLAGRQIQKNKAIRCKSTNSALKKLVLGFENSGTRPLYSGGVSVCSFDIGKPKQSNLSTTTHAAPKSAQRFVTTTVIRAKETNNGGLTLSKIVVSLVRDWVLHSGEAEAQRHRKNAQGVLDKPTKVASVLDLNCGSGIGLALSEAFGFADIEGANWDPDMLSAAFKEEESSYTTLYQLEKGEKELPFAEDSYDLVTFLPDPENTLATNEIVNSVREVARVTKTGGSVVLGLAPSSPLREAIMSMQQEGLFCSDFEGEYNLKTGSEPTPTLFYVLQCS